MREKDELHNLYNSFQNTAFKVVLRGRSKLRGLYVLVLM